MASRGAANRHGHGAMTARDDAHRDYAVLALSLALAATFVYASIDKIGEPQQFADNIAGFAILPAMFTNLLALTLPVFEIVCGALLLVPLTRRVASLAIALTCIVFFSCFVFFFFWGMFLFFSFFFFVVLC
jgi:uncharacterized membrane protein YphA (DoxX/SURF4 family)